MSEGRWVRIFRCDQCIHQMPRPGTTDYGFCAKYKKPCPANGVPGWCRLKRVRRESGKT